MAPQPKENHPRINPAQHLSFAVSMQIIRFLLKQFKKIQMVLNIFYESKENVLRFYMKNRFSSQVLVVYCKILFTETRWLN